MAPVIEKPTYQSEQLKKYPLNTGVNDALFVDELSPIELANCMIELLNSERSLLYSINVIDPPNVERFLTSEQLPAGLQKRAKEQFLCGYFYNEEIRLCSLSDFQKALFAIVRHANEVEIAARVDEKSPLIRHRVKIKPTRTP